MLYNLDEMRENNCYAAKIAGVAFVCLLLVCSIAIASRPLRNPPPAPWLSSSSPLSSRTSRKLDLSCGEKGDWPKPRSSLSELRQSNRVYNGHTAINGQFPSHVDLQIAIGRYQIISCGGTLIAPNVVLTAAHCLDRAVSIKVYPSIIRPDRRSSNFIKARRFCQSTEWRTRRTADDLYDYGVIVLERPVDINDNVKTACFPSRPATPSDKCYAIGNGLTARGTSSSLKYFPVSRVSGRCRRFGRYAPEFIACFVQRRSQLVKGGQSSNCQGDSGEGVMCFIDNEWQVHGIVSTGPANRCASGNFGTYYTNVVKLSDKIASLCQHCGS